MRETDLAWAAGLFEGEGSMSCSKRHDATKWPTFVASVQMTDEDVVRRFAVLADCGTITTRVDPRGNRKQTWTWCASGHLAADFLRTLMPYFGVRRTRRAQELFALMRPKAVACVQCGELFKPKDARHVCCSMECREAHNPRERSAYFRAYNARRAHRVR